MRLTAALSLIAAIAVACGGAPPAAEPTPPAGTPPAATQPPADTTPPPAPTPAAGTFGDGQHRVGVDIQPGTYRLRQPASLCYWARLSGFGGQLGDIVANDNVDGFAVVTIAPSDAGFESRGCGQWSDDLSAVIAPNDPIPSGTLIVGTDLEPGTYRAADVNLCYWARLSGFGGGIGDIIANDNVMSGSAIVTIAAGDRGFQSARCGEWSR